MINTTGYHLIIDLDTRHEAEISRLKDLNGMQNLLQSAAQAAGATCLKVDGHKFGAEQGVTAFIMLAESHISVHTWPENGYAAFDIFMCGVQGQNIRQAAAVIEQSFSHAQTRQQLIERTGMQTASDSGIRGVG